MAPSVLSMCALVFGIWPAGLENIVESFYVSHLHLKELPSLQVWHGWSLELVISATILGMGSLLFYVAEKWEVWSQAHPFPDFASLWNRLMEGSVLLAEKLTLLLRGSSVHRHLIVLLLFFVCGISGVLIVEEAVPWRILTNFPVSIYRVAVFVMIVCTSLAVPFLSRGLSQVLALASSGFFVTLYFVFYKAPDLAMTQILIEVVTGVMLFVMVWVFRNEVTVKEHTKRTVLRLVTAFLFAMTGIAISLSYSGLEGPKPLSEYFLASSIPLAKGANVVNTILVDFRGMDTLGEVTVLLIAGIVIIGLVTRKQPPDISWDSKIVLVSSDILRTLTPILFFMINLFALYLLIRGHNQAGGGFVGGLASGIGFVVLGFSLQLSVLKKIIPINLLLLSGIGIVLVLSVGLLPLILGRAFLTHGVLNLPTALIFDIGVFIGVLGITLISIFSLRSDALREREYYG